MNQSEWLLKHEAKSSSLKDVQIWLKDHTTLDSLFMANPAYSRGWREYSERSYFGSIQEWVGTPNLYVAKRKVFHQGLERLKIFGIDLNNITAEEVKQSNKNLYLKEMQRIVHKKFLDLNSSRISNLHTEYGVDYIILNKNHWHKKELNLPIAYENRHYKILSLNPNR